VVVSVAALILTWVLALPIGIYSASAVLGGRLRRTFVGFIGSRPELPPRPGAALLWASSVQRAHRRLFSPELQDAPWSMARVVGPPQAPADPRADPGSRGHRAADPDHAANLLDELRKPYVVTARSKGLTESTVILKYPVRWRSTLREHHRLHAAVHRVGQHHRVARAGLPTVGPLLLKALIAQDMFLAGTIVLLLA
jgi:peptide/nickel transport system permease protein